MFFEFLLLFYYSIIILSIIKFIFLEKNILKYRPILIDLVIQKIYIIYSNYISFSYHI